MKRMTELIDGSDLPQTNVESLFVTAYGEAVQGTLLDTVTEEIGEAYVVTETLMTDDELAAMLFGYMKGQRARSEIYDLGGPGEQDYIMIPIENKKTH